MFFNPVLWTLSSINLPKLSIPWIIGMSAIVGTTVVITQSNSLQSTIKTTLSPIKNTFKKAIESLKVLEKTSHKDQQK